MVAHIFGCVLLCFFQKMKEKYLTQIENHTLKKLDAFNMTLNITFNITFNMTFSITFCSCVISDMFS